jgi:nitroreductase/NAD-dependent dihydropyrimidine dehydrogenase PreA subunit
MSEFIIDKELCIKCGLCAKDCPQDAITMDEFPVLNEELCFECSHCLAVCPTGALSILGKSPSDSTLLEKNIPNADQMETLIKGRRSVRQYRDENIAPETIQKLLNIASHAPTGVNLRSVQFTVIDNKEDMDIFRDAVYRELATVLPEEVPEDNHILEYMVFAVNDQKENGGDMLFRGAPHLVITSSPIATPCPEADTHIALSYFELMAQSMGIGTLWNGLSKAAFSLMPGFLARIDIPEDHMIGYVMVFGKPAVKYHRTVERGSANVKSVNLDVLSKK